MLARTRRLLSLLAVLALCAESMLASDAAPPRDSLALVLAAAAPGDDAQAREIARIQASLRADGSPRLLERLAWLFIERGRAQEDPGYTKLAEHAARALEERVPGDAGARLVLGHALVSLHRFREAEVVARELVAERGAPFDHGLLGDAQLEQGRIAEAGASYQAMMDLRPDAHAYSRAAYLRWLTGDLEGALDAMRVAAEAVSPRNRDVFAWSFAQLALYQLRAGRLGEAERSCAAALAVQPDSAAALMAQGRLRLAQDRNLDAALALGRAAERSPLPEHLWTYADALREIGREAEASAVEQRLLTTGEGSDPRGLALWLASRGRDPARALALAERELGVRQDVFTLAVSALARSRAGDAETAWPLMQRALAPGTPDARLALHAGLVAQAAGRRDEAAKWLRAAQRRRPLLLPSERRELERALTESHDVAEAAPSPGGTT